MKYTVKKNTGVYVQHSKRLANWAIAQWVVIALVIIAALYFADWTDAETSVLESVSTWSATLAGVVITGYMGNSSVEKYANRKFAITETTEG